MRSPAEWRVPLERACRVLALAAVALLLWRVGLPRAAAPAVVRAARDLEGALRTATTHRTADLALVLDSVPGRVAREWVGAVRGAGTRVRWSAAESLPATALSVEPAPGPEGSVRVSVLAPAGSALVLSDSVSVFDSASVGDAGVRVVETLTGGALRAAQPRGVAVAPAPESARARAVLVIARAGWEGKFTAAALEEAGWLVETDFLVTAPVGPGARSPVMVRTRGAGAAIDTARYAAVVALDGAAASRGGAIAAYVRSGGGLVLAGDAALAPVLAGLSPARPGAPFEGGIGALAGTHPRRGLAGRRLEGARGDAIVIERSGAAVTVAARREELGRVVLLGYDHTWRWRMLGGSDALSAHRDWWSGLVASVAHHAMAAPTHPVERAGANDPAPLASLVAALGPAASTDAGPRPRTRRWEAWLLITCILLLMAEWTSRRTRGAV